MDKRVFLILLLLFTSFSSLIPTVIATDPVIVFGEITNRDGVGHCYSRKRDYRFRAYVLDDDGATDISKVYLRGTDDGDATIFEVRADNLNSTPSWSIETGTDIIDLNISSCSWVEDGDYGMANFYISFEWDCPLYGDCGIFVYVEDSNGNSDGWEKVKSDYYDIISKLVTVNLGTEDARDDIGESNKVDGYLGYALYYDSNSSSMVPPPTSEINLIHLHNSTHDSVASTPTITPGAGYFIISFNIPNIAQLNTYHVYIDIVDDYADGDALDGDTVSIIGDRYNVTSFWASDYNPQIGDNITLYAIFESEYDSHICDGDDSVTIEDLQFNYDPLEEYCFAEIGKDEEGTYYFDTLNSLYENTYEIYDGNLDYNLSITWGYVQYELYGLFYENGTYSGNVTVNAHFTGSLDTFTLEQYIEKTYENQPIMFSWKLEGGATRRIYLIENIETHYLFTPYDEYAGYSFEIRDYSGVIGAMDS